MNLFPKFDNRCPVCLEPMIRLKHLLDQSGNDRKFEASFGHCNQTLNIFWSGITKLTIRYWSVGCNDKFEVGRGEGICYVPTIQESFKGAQVRWLTSHYKPYSPELIARLRKALVLS